MMFVNTVKYYEIREILSCQYFLDFTIFTMFLMFHNIVHFIVQHQFADVQQRRCQPENHIDLDHDHRPLHWQLERTRRKLQSLSQ